MNFFWYGWFFKANTINVDFKENVNFLHANCAQFSHPLQHMGKTVDDCPVIAIDSFKHMYLFPDFSLVHQEGRLLQFVKDLHSGKLHREFHQGPGNSSYRNSYEKYFILR